MKGSSGPAGQRDLNRAGQGSWGGEGEARGVSLAGGKGSGNLHQSTTRLKFAKVGLTVALLSIGPENANVGAEASAALSQKWSHKSRNGRLLVGLGVYYGTLAAD